MWDGEVAQELNVRDKSRVRNAARLGEIGRCHFAGFMVVVCSLEMVVGYRIDNGNGLGGVVGIHEVAGGMSTSQEGRGSRRPLPGGCITLGCKDGIKESKEDGLWCSERGTKGLVARGDKEGGVEECWTSNNAQDRVQRAVTGIATATLTYVYL